MAPYRLSGDEGVGSFEPEDLRRPSFVRVEQDVLERLARWTGLTATVSDVLDELGWATAVSAHHLRPRHRSVGTIVGHVQTLTYLPSRRHVLYEGREEEQSRLSHLVLFELLQPGDVAVVDARAEEPVSVLGGLAASAAVRAGLSGVIVDGAVRDVDQIEASGLALWSRAVTPRSGKSRMEAVAINAPVQCGGVQAAPGDLAVADATGICFVPAALVADVVGRVLEVSESESAQLG